MLAVQVRKQLGLEVPAERILLGLPIVSYGTSDDSSTSFFVNSRTLIESRGVTESAAQPHQFPLGSVASYLICADVRTLQ